MKFNKRDIVIILIMVLFGIGFMVVGLGLIGNLPQVYKELIIETTARYGSNKSGELSLFWSMLFGGTIIIIFIYYFINKRKSKQNIVLKDIEKSKIDTTPYFILASLVCNLFSYIIMGSFNTILLAFSGILIFYYCVLPQRVIEGTVFSILLFYTLVAISYLIYILFDFQSNTSIILLITIALTILCSKYFRKSNANLYRSILLAQILLPLLILAFLVTKYNYNGEYVIIPINISIYTIWVMVAIIGLIFILLKVKNNWYKAEANQLNNLISISSCILISIFNINSGAMQYITSDTHHPAEAIIAYQQIFDKGQIPYVNYYPVSGLFPTVLGGILKLVGGKMTMFYMAAIIFCSLITAIIIFLCHYYLNNTYCLIIASMFVLAQIPLTERTYLILPTILILALPNLINNRNLWLKIWIILILLGGLYYPLYGVASLLGSLPFGIIQFFEFIKSGEFLNNRKKKKFFIEWLVVFGIIAVFIPTLFNMAKHTFVYSSQSILADGIAVFGQSYPDNFMPYLVKTEVIRMALFYSIRFVLPTFLIWILTIILVKFISSNKYIVIKNSSSFLMITYTIISFIICLTYTMVRADEGIILSRTSSVIMPLVLVVLFIVLSNNFISTVYKYLLLGFFVAISIILNRSNLNTIDNKIIYEYNIGSDYTYITDQQSDEIENIGHGFIKTDVIEAFTKYNDLTKELLKYDSNLSFLGLDYGYYYVLNLKTCAQPSFVAIKSLSATKETINIIKKEHPVIFAPINSIEEYYLYYWLTQTDEYEFCPQYTAFLPVELIEKMNGIATANSVNNGYNLLCDCGKIANSLGKSKDSLLDNEFTMADCKIILSDPISIVDDGNSQEYKTINYICDLDNNIDGNTADYIFMDLKVINNQVKSTSTSWLKDYLTKSKNGDNIIVKISWANDEESMGDAYNYMTCTLGNGKLIIPLGSNINWLLNSHKQFTISISGLYVDSELTIEDIGFLKSSANQLLVSEYKK